MFGLDCFVPRNDPEKCRVRYSFAIPHMKVIARSDSDKAIQSILRVRYSFAILTPLRVTQYMFGSDCFVPRNDSKKYECHCAER